MNPTEGDKIREYYDGYWAARGERREEVMREWWAPAFDYLHSGLGELGGRELVEIGAGDGVHAGVLSEMGAKVVAVDFSAESVARVKASPAAAAGAVAPVRADAHALPFKSGRFDAAVVTNMLMFTDKKRVLAECARVVKPGGKVALIEPLRYPHIIMLARILEPHFWKMKYSFMTVGEVEKLGGMFARASHREFLLLSSFAAPFARAFPASKAARGALRVLSRLESGLPGRIKPLRNLCYLTVAHFET